MLNKDKTVHNFTHNLIALNNGYSHLDLNKQRTFLFLTDGLLEQEVDVLCTVYVLGEPWPRFNMSVSLDSGLGTKVKSQAVTWVRA